MAGMDTCYVSCACNRVPHCADWGRNGLIAYGACQAVALYNPEPPGRVLHTLTAHKSRVNTVRWIQNGGSEEDELLSGSTDGTVIVWNTSENKYLPVATLAGHTSVVTLVDGVYTTSRGSQGSKPRTLVASASVDSTLRIWERKEGTDTFDCVQTIAFGTGFVMALSWVILPGSSTPMLACGGDDQKIRIYIETGGQMTLVQVLQGHEDWVRGMEFTVDDRGDILLASCAQDYFIRIWRISARDENQVTLPERIADLSLDEEIKMKENTFSFKSQDCTRYYAVSLESVLAGHENWVYSIRWQPATYTDGRRHQSMCLLSASMDKTMILWKPDPNSGVWLEEVRVGEVGGNNLGFYGGVFSPNGKSILAHGYQGAFHLWHQQQDTAAWEPGVTVGGHFDSVQDLSWEPEKGHYLLSLSLDQTTRLHGYWWCNSLQQGAWHEIARPQIHGYDLQCLSFISRYMMASGADEKVVRVFEAPKNFLENFSKICDINITQEEKDKLQLPEGASVPALGLSNKAVFQGEEQNLYKGSDLKPAANEQYSETYFSPLQLSEPPTEENLLQNTLWPETQKLYGHGYEIFALAAHPNGTLLASACKAAKAEHAYVILWDVSSWRQCCHLAGHSLTVTQLAFSHSGEYLLSVSRDRTWNLYQQKTASETDTDPLYQRVAGTDKKTSVHSRIIWSCAWSHDDRYFVTASRDKKVIVWRLGDPAGGAVPLSVSAYSSLLTLPDSVTAVDFAPALTPDGQYLVAAGLDNGCILLYKWNENLPQSESSWGLVASLHQQNAHHLTVKRLKFRPVLGQVRQSSEVKDNSLLLASCGSDHTVKIHNITLE